MCAAFHLKYKRGLKTGPTNARAIRSFALFPFGKPSRLPPACHDFPSVVPHSSRRLDSFGNLAETVKKRRAKNHPPDGTKTARSTVSSEAPVGKVRGGGLSQEQERGAISFHPQNANLSPLALASNRPVGPNSFFHRGIVRKRIFACEKKDRTSHTIGLNLGPLFWFIEREEDIHPIC